MAFDGGAEVERSLDGEPVGFINADLTTGVDVTSAVRLTGNAGVSFMGDTKGGAFDIDEQTAADLLSGPNPDDPQPRHRSTVGQWDGREPSSSGVDRRLPAREVVRPSASVIVAVVPLAL